MGQNPANRDSFVVRDGVLLSYRGNAERVVIPAGVVRIGPNAFNNQGRGWVRWVTIPKGVTEVGDYAFSRCDALETLTLPDGLRRMGRGVCSGCRSLRAVNLPDSLTELGAYAFEGCRSLREVDLPGDMEAVAEYAFKDCAGLRRVNLPPEVTRIGNSAFWGCARLERLRLPMGVTAIDRWAFFGCTSLRSIRLPDSLRTIGSYAFGHCHGLREVTLPAGITQLGSDAFTDCTGLERATVPDCAHPPAVFSGCKALRAYTAPADSDRFRMIDGVALSRDGRKLLAYPPGRRCDRYDIPDTVREVCDRAFEGASVALVVTPVMLDRFSGTAANGKDAPFVALHRKDLLSEVSKPIYLGAPEGLYRFQKRPVLEGFLYAQRMDLPEMRPWVEQYHDFMRREQAPCLNLAWRNEDMARLMLRLNILPPGAAAQMLRKLGTARTELAAALRAYCEEHGTD